WIRILRRRFGRPQWRMERAVPILVTQWTLGIMYLGPVTARLVDYGYPGWADGVTLQAILLERWIAFGGGSFFVIKSYWLCLIAQHLVLLLEGGFILTVFFPAFAPIA